MPLTVAALGFIAFQINAAINNRELEDLSIDTVRREIGLPPEKWSSVK